VRPRDALPASPLRRQAPSPGTWPPWPCCSQLGARQRLQTRGDGPSPLGSSTRFPCREPAGFRHAGAACTLLVCYACVCASCWSALLWQGWLGCKRADHLVLQQGRRPLAAARLWPLCHVRTCARMRAPRPPPESTPESAQAHQLLPLFRGPRPRVSCLHGYPVGLQGVMVPAWTPMGTPYGMDDGMDDF
jgi:hypothetical protein